VFGARLIFTNEAKPLGFKMAEADLQRLPKYRRRRTPVLIRKLKHPVTQSRSAAEIDVCGVIHSAASCNMEQLVLYHYLKSMSTTKSTLAHGFTICHIENRIFRAVLKNGRFNMTTDIEMIRQAVAFAQTKLDSLRPGDILNLKEDFWTLTGRNDVDNKNEFLDKLTMEEMSKVQTEFTGWFQHLADHNSSAGVLGLHSLRSVRYTVAAEAPSDVFHFFMYNDDDPRSSITLAMMLCLARSGISLERFRRCPECKSIFVLSRKPDQRDFYCSSRCAGRVATRNSRAGKLKRQNRKVKKRK
jgi:hypothetical protein